jgi:hypothetical protein
MVWTGNPLKDALRALPTDHGGGGQSKGDIRLESPVQIQKVRGKAHTNQRSPKIFATLVAACRERVGVALPRIDIRVSVQRQASAYEEVGCMGTIGELTTWSTAMGTERLAGLAREAQGWPAMACMSSDIHAHALGDRHVGADMVSMLHAKCGHARAEHVESY